MEPVASGAGATTYSEAAGVWSVQGPVPDYVVGTDWLPRPPEPIVLPDVTWPEMEPPGAAAAPPVADAAWRDEAPTARSAYPSEQGDILAGVGRTPSTNEATEPPAA
jgi:hypothetical protein